MRPIGRVGVFVYGNGSIRRTIFVQVLQIKSFLIFSYIGCGKSTKNGTENLSGIPVYNGFTARYARAYEKANNRSGLCVCVCVCVSTFSEPCKDIALKNTGEVKFSRAVLLL